MILLAIDPGNEKSAWVLYNLGKSRPIHFVYRPNHLVMLDIDTFGRASTKIDAIACEMLQNYGMGAGRSMYETAMWVGMFRAKAEDHGIPFRLYGRPTIKGHLGAHNDASVRTSLRNRLCTCNGARQCKKGCPMHGMNNDVRAALALAVALDENQSLKEW